MSEIKNIFELLEQIEQRTAMFIPDRSIHTLQMYLHGYKTCLFVHNINEPEVPDFKHFPEWLRTRFNWNLKYGWAYAIEQHANEKEDAIQKFFVLAREFKFENLNSIWGNYVLMDINPETSTPGIGVIEPSLEKFMLKLIGELEGGFKTIVRPEQYHLYFVDLGDEQSFELIKIGDQSIYDVVRQKPPFLYLFLHQSFDIQKVKQDSWFNQWIRENQ